MQDITSKFAAAKLKHRKFFDVWHYVPDEEGRPQPISPEDYKRKPLKYRLMDEEKRRRKELAAAKKAEESEDEDESDGEYDEEEEVVVVEKKKE